MESNNVEKQTITANGETFKRGTYNGISVLIREKDGFINATEMCNQFNKRFRKINENHAWQAYYEAFCKEYYARPEMGEQEKTPIYQLNKGYSVKENYLRGYYVDPRLINYIAFWASPRYAVLVGKIMDAINNKVHEVLSDQSLPDTVENAEPVLKAVIDEILPENDQELVDRICWGYRDSAHKLDAWEKADLDNMVAEYKKLNERLLLVEEKIKEFGVFVNKYHPELRV